MEAFEVRQISGAIGIMTASCIAEARQKAEKVNAIVKGPYPIEDYQLIRQLEK